MPCKQENIFYLLDEELSPAETALVCKHIGSCPTCRALLEDLKPAVEVFEKMSAPKLEPYEALLVHQKALAPESDWESQAKSTPGGPVRRGRRRRRARRWPWMVALAACTLIAFAAGVLLAPARQRLSSGLSSLFAPLSARSQAGVSAFEPGGAAPGDKQNETVRRILPHQALSEQAGGAVVVDRLSPSGTRVIWRYEAPEAP